MDVTSNPAAMPRARAYIPALFTVTIFTSALLLFFVQPLFTRLVLPQIGGAAAVWTTAMLFFQTVLIGGYVYAHLLSRHLPVRGQIGVHLVLLCLAIFFLPLAVPAGWEYDADRPVVTQTLWLYALGVGLPFAVLSANAPLIQSWYRRSGGPSAEDPYFLYAASNLGSLVALLAFPLAAEPLFGVTAIALAWSVGFVALGGLLLASGLSARLPAAAAAISDTPARPINASNMALWAFLAFIPSSLMLAVTSKISMDVGSFPLVWVIPLSLYLLTFVLVFAPGSSLTAARLRLCLPLALAVLTFYTLNQSVSWISVGLLLAGFFCVSLLAHRVLFDTRPDPRHLTLFYITMSVGGAFGGIFNSILAPLVFDRLYEITITICLAALLMISKRSDRLPRDLALGLGAAAVVFLPVLNILPGLDSLAATTRAGLCVLILLIALVILRNKGIAAATALVVAVGISAMFGQAPAVLTDRSFFGPHVVKDEKGMRIYSNGTTVHGAEWLDDFGKRPRPLYYYHKNGPLARIVVARQAQGARTIGIVGLGVGAMSCYSQPGEDWHFYEIDRKVVDIAFNPALFGFMTECGADAAIHLGDARIVLQKQTDLRYDVLIIDAYSSDAVPVHLATVEALDLYRNRLKPGGVLVFHISNRFYDLSRPLSAAAQALGLAGRVQMHLPDAAGIKDGDTATTAMILAASEADLGTFATDPAWAALPTDTEAPWTDDHANLLSALN